MRKSIFVITFYLLTFNLYAAPIEYRIVFTQTFFHPVVGIRNLEGSFFVDDSILGSGNENMNYGPYSPEMSSITDFTVTLDSPNYKGGGIYDFDLPYTQAINTPPFSTVLSTGSAGEVTNIAGALTLAGTISSLELGRDTYEGEYLDVQEIDFTLAVVVSRGTYVIERVSPVPIPTAVWLFSSGLLGLIGLARRKAL